jgi:alkylhydroperoxidase family enzyme
VRSQPLPEAEWDDEMRAVLASLLPAERRNARDAGNVLATLVRHPALVRAYLPFNAYLLRDSTLSARTKEVAMLRTVLRRDCSYIWSHHLPIAARAGLSTDDVAGIEAGHCPDPQDQLVVSAVDELADRNTITDATWEGLGRSFTDEQRLDLIFTFGGYAMLAMAVNALGIEEET